jgi:CheY-like chemotaxis protein
MRALLINDLAEAGSPNTETSSYTSDLLNYKGMGVHSLTVRGACQMLKCAPETILVVEDDATVRRLIVRVLQRSGFRVIAADSAQYGLALFQSHPNAIKLAILDMVMPGMSGLDLANELRCACPEVRILYISGYIDSVAMESIGHRSPESVLLKPFGKGALVERVQQLLALDLEPQPPGTARTSNPGAKDGDPVKEAKAS